MAQGLEQRNQPVCCKEDSAAFEAQAGGGGGQVVAADEADTSTSAASSAKPARRRRLARRRQYQKPRRIASSYQHSALADFHHNHHHHYQPTGLLNGNGVDEADCAVSWCRASSFERHHEHQKGSPPHLVEARSLELYHPSTTSCSLANYSSSSLESCPGEQQQQRHQLHRQPQHPTSPTLAARSMSFLSGLTSGHLTDIGESSSSLRRHNILDAKQQSLSQLLLTERKQQLLLQQQQRLHPPPQPQSTGSRSLHQMHKAGLASHPPLVKDASSSHRSVANQMFTQNNNNNKCIDNVHFSLFFPGSLNETSPISINHSDRTDPRLYKDDVDIKFSRALNSCKLPQIRYASKGRLFERLTDLRFLSIDFLNTFLLTYRVFTCAVDVLEALKSVHYNCDRYYSQPAERHLSCQQQNVEQPAESYAHKPAASPALNKGHAMEQAPSTRPYATPSPSNGIGSDELVSVKDDTISIQRMQRQSSFGSVAQDKHQEGAAGRSHPVDQSKSTTMGYGKPLVPPRSPCGSHLEGKPQLHLLAPIQTGSLIQKRRSTISALSPITSSEASSMNNLSMSHQPRQQAAPRRTTVQTPVAEHQDSSDKSVSLQSSLSTGKLSSVMLENLEEPPVVGQERLRSSSVSIRLDHASFGDEPSDTSGAFLTVPLGRQVRSNSCSQMRPISQQASNNSMQQQQPNYASGSPMNTEHWRLCYKKAIAHDQQWLAPQVGARRASSSDLDQRQSFRMTLNLAPVPTDASTAIVGSATKHSNQLFEYTINNKPPQVPPSSPIEPVHMEGQQPSAGHLFLHQETCDKRGASASSKRAGARQIPLVSTSGSSLIASESDSLSSSSSSSLNSDNSSITGTRRSRRRPNSQERDLIRQSSSSQSEGSSCGRAKRRQQHSKRIEPADGRNTGRRIRQRSHFSFHPHLKEIELNESKLLDYDTSADEDKIFTSSSDDDDDQHDNHSERLSEPEVAPQKQAELRAKPKQAPTTGEKRAKPATISQTSSTIANDINDHQPSTPAKSSAANHQPINRLVDSFTPDRSISQFTTPRASFQYQQSHNDAARTLKAGVIVTGSRPKVASRRSSTASAASAFAAATAASSNPLLTQPPIHGSSSVQAPLPGYPRQSGDQLNQRYGSISCLQQSGGRPTPPAPHPARRFGADQQPRQSATDQNTSLCNSRASSRLSSCAGLENTSSSSNFQNFTSSSACYQQTSNRHSAPMQSPPHSIQSSATTADIHHHHHHHQPPTSRTNSKNQINVRSVATIRVLSVLRHWVSKQAQDFVGDSELAMLTQEFLQDLINDGSLLPAEHRAAQQLHQMIQKSIMSRQDQVDLDVLLAEPKKPSNDSIDTLSALEIAECMTYLDHKIFLAIRSEEFLGQAWMKADKTIKAPHILLITKRFNDVSRLVSSEIIRVADISKRVSIIEKWANVAHICRVVHNFNGVLQICAAFTNSAIYRLKKTWDKVSKTTKATIDQLQTLVSTDSRFRNMRDAINRCDPPSIPYVGMYLADLSFIEEGTPNYSPEGLLNFSKMRMIAHVIREIQHLQNGCYKITPSKQVLNYLLDTSRHLQDEEMYRCSLRLEPKSTGKSSAQLANAATANQGKSVVASNITNAQSPSSATQQKQNPPPPPTPAAKQSTVGTYSDSPSRAPVPLAARKG